MQKAKKKRYTRYKVDGKDVSEEDFNKMSDKIMGRFDKVMDGAMSGVDRAMEGVDRAMEGMDKTMDRAMSGVDRAMEGMDKTMSKADKSIIIEKISDISWSKRALYAMMLAWSTIFIVGFGIYFLGKTLTGSYTKPPEPVAIEMKTIQEKPDASIDILKKL